MRRPASICALIFLSIGLLASAIPNPASAAAPEVTIGAKPNMNSNSTSATFTFSSSEPGSTFECSVDDTPFTPCEASGVTYDGLVDGNHRFQVIARASSGDMEPGGSHYEWGIDTVAPEPHFLLSPPKLSTSSEASFAYAASEILTGLMCALDSSILQPCPTFGSNYTGLADGPHTYVIQASDLAGNKGPVDSYSWTVFTRPPPVPARLRQMTIKGPAAATVGKRATYRFRISNSGDFPATGVKVGIRGSGMKADRSVGTIGAGETKVVPLRVKPRKSGYIRLVFKTSSTNAGGSSVRTIALVKPSNAANRR